jgi:hypothetical protein
VALFIGDKMNFLNELSQKMLSSLETLGVWHDVITNFFGVIAIILLVISFQMKSRVKLLLVFLFSQLIWAIYFVLQGDLASGIMCTVAITMSLVFMQREKHKWANSIFWLFFFIAIIVTCSILTFKDWRDLFPLMGNLLTTISFFTLNEKLLRSINVGTYLCWMGNSISKLYVVALISDTLTLISVIISIVRFNVKKSEKQINTEENA